MRGIKSGRSQIDGVEDVHRPFEDQVARGRVTRIGSPAGRRRAVLVLADARIGAVREERANRVEIAGPRGGVKSRVPVRRIHRGRGIVADIHRRTVPDEHLDDARGALLAGADDQSSPLAVWRQRAG